ncbi:MAG: NADH-ubiquinone oxidoreductase-F iron-sulfur binding region domain-containing protein [Actinomycetota bacterium]|nr:NADH-ubiquinone oxidoreductase-F iron-sulfur binding region domain-containing protein [Actinomycetota bacterium]
MGESVVIRVCTGPGCVVNGSLNVADRFEEVIAAVGAEDRVRVVRTGCHGLCEEGPLVAVSPQDIFYPRVSEEMAAPIVERLMEDGSFVEEYLFRPSENEAPIERYSQLPFNLTQQRIVLRSCGVIDAEDIDDAIACGAYDGLRRVLAGFTPDALIDEIERSGLRGRGGAGFPTGRKWRLARQADGEPKYVICNADEGDPGAFMDRSVIEGDPHSVLEGMAIAAFAIGTDTGYVYVRAEYPLAARRLRIAVARAEERGLLGDRILGSDFSFSVRVTEGAGAFVCGESTALMFSIEGKRGMPRVTPPRSVEKGLWGKPTVLNNVETFANVPWIVTQGPDRFRGFGTENSSGTKVFALTGRVRNTGLIEVPMGTTIREIVYDIGGGVRGGRRLKAVQMGGPSGGCLPEKYLDLPVDFDSLDSVGAMMGSGGLVVLDEGDCMVDMARYFLTFTQDESCGKCVPCRIGTKRMLEIVTRITNGSGEEGDIEKLERLASDVSRTSLCGLGQSAPNPVLTTIRYFREEYEEHIRESRCRAGACAELSRFIIHAEACKGCTVCKKRCPVGAIRGEMKEPHAISVDRCIKCGVCVEHCPFDAIERI